MKEEREVITREVVDWVNEQARRLRETGSYADLWAALPEGKRRFPDVPRLGMLTLRACCRLTPFKYCELMSEEPAETAPEPVKE